MDKNGFKVIKQEWQSNKQVVPSKSTAILYIHHETNSKNMITTVAFPSL